METDPVFKQINIIEQAKIVWSKYTLEDDEIYMTDDRTKHDTLLYQDDSLDLFWFKKQALFIDGLTDREVFLLKSYTRNGDEVINSLFKKNSKELVPELMRIVKKLQTPRIDGVERINIFDPVKLTTITTSNVISIAVKYANEVFAIFKKAPPIENPMRVFRGLTPADGEETLTVFPLRGITSTTYNPMGHVLDTYTRNNSYLNKLNIKPQLPLLSNCCVYDMVLRPGVRAIWLEPITEFNGEQEIVLLPSIIQASYSHPRKKIYAPKGRSYRPLEITTFDVTVNPIIGKTFTMRGGLKRFRRKPRKTHRK
jgi:hypothetical protein